MEEKMEKRDFFKREKIKNVKKTKRYKEEEEDDQIFI